MAKVISFCVTGRSGLGHLRRAANIAAALRGVSPGLAIELVANATPEGLTSKDLEPFTRVRLAERSDMAAALALSAGPVVVDTAVLPGLERVKRPLCLVLRETPAERCAAFTLTGGRSWDLVILPNPPGSWTPPQALALGRLQIAVGWIVRDAGPSLIPQTIPLALVASGGGGAPETAAAFRDAAARLFASARQAAPRFRLMQNLGPRAPEQARLAEADETIHAAGELDRWFARADLVVSTAGYNSVLELARTDTPALLIGVARAYDDQWARVRAWGPRLGMAYDPGDPDAAAVWAAEVLRTRRRRAPLDLGPPGAAAAARAILELAVGA